MSYPMDTITKGGGLFYQGTGGQTVTAYSLIYMGADGRWYLADADTAATLPTLGLAPETLSTGRLGRVLFKGIVQNRNWAWTIGGEIYASGTAGALTQTPPAITQQVAIAIASDTIFFDPKGETWGVATGCPILEGATAFVGFDACKEPFTNYFLCDGTADDVQINTAEAYVTALGGGRIVLEEGTYDIVDPIIPTGNDLWYMGQGESTFLDGDGLATTEHVFHITGRSRITISDMSMQTENGGGKTCHCIFIEDGSDDFHINKVTFVDSDDNCIHVEGTTINLGYVDSCHFDGADGHGIYVNMDGGNLANRINVINCDMVGVGNAGVYFDASGGNYYCVVESNIIAASAGIGIYVDDFFNGQIIRNECVLGSLSGIHVVGSSETSITDNQCLTNERHGIFLTSTTVKSLVAGNICSDNDDHDTATYDGINLDTDCTGNVITNNICERNHNRGITIRGANNLVSNNRVAENDRQGIYVNQIDNTINDNNVLDNGQDAAGTYHGIQLGTSCGGCQVSGNYVDGFGDSQEDGIYLETTVHNCQVEGNYCYDGMGSGITIEDNNDYNQIVDNYLYNNDDYGIQIITVNALENTVKNNYFNNNGVGTLLDVGTDTGLTTKSYQFQHGGTVEGTVAATEFVSATASAKGWQVDAGTDWAVALGQLPQELQEIIRMKIWAVALGAPIGTPGQMHLEIIINAGADNLAFNTEPVALANFDSITTDYVNTDVVHWSVDSGDDADIGSMVGGMSIEFKVIYEDGDDPDGATNAVFRSVEVEYV